MKSTICVLAFFISSSLLAQYSFSGSVDLDRWEGTINLSLVDDYRKLSGIYNEQIIARVRADSNGYFEFTGDQLEAVHQIYRIHVDNCNSLNGDSNHFSGQCPDSKEVLFLAKNTDTIQFPFGFEKEMFCEIQSSSEKSLALMQIDSLKEHMAFALSEIRTSANRRLNTKKWFSELQEIGGQLNAPLANLYIYAFLSDRSSDFYEYYLNDLKANPYYAKLEESLTTDYQGSSYLVQFKREIASDRFIIDQSPSKTNWVLGLAILLVISAITNFILIYRIRRLRLNSQSNLTNALTKQEQKVLDLILQDHSNKDIADTIFVSLSTVKTHINSIYKKLGVQSRTEVKQLFNNKL